ncbi:MAG: glycosyltransferase, partial [Myxococcota bacterium]
LDNRDYDASSAEEKRALGRGVGPIAIAGADIADHPFLDGALEAAFDAVSTLQDRGNASNNGRAGARHQRPRNKRMKLLFSSLPAHDHLLEMLPVAAAAKREGHEVAFAVTTRFAEVVRGAGFEHFAAGEDWVRAAIDDLEGDVLPEEMEEFTQRFMADMFCGPAALAMAKQVNTIIDRWQPDVVLRDTGEMGGLLAAERAKLPHVTVGVLDFNGMFLGKGVVAALDERRRDYGLEPDPEGLRQYAYGHINMLCPDFAPEELELPNVYSVRVDGVLPGDTLPEWMGNLADADKPLVYASFGTAASTIPGFGPALRNVINGLGAVDANAIVSVGKGLDWNGEPILDEAAVPKNVKVVDWVPQALLLRSVDVLLTHAGPATARQGIVNGLPMVAVPLLFDAFEISNRLCKHGLAQQIDWTKLTAEQVTESVKEVLTNPSYRRQARKLQRKALTVPPIDNASVRFIERIVNGVNQ